MMNATLKSLPRPGHFAVEVDGEEIGNLEALDSGRYAAWYAYRRIASGSLDECVSEVLFAAAADAEELGDAAAEVYLKLALKRADGPADDWGSLPSPDGNDWGSLPGGGVR